MINLLDQGEFHFVVSKDKFLIKGLALVDGILANFQDSGPNSFSELDYLFKNSDIALVLFQDFCLLLVHFSAKLIYLFELTFVLLDLVLHEHFDIFLLLLLYDFFVVL